MTEKFSLSPPLRFGMISPGIYRAPTEDLRSYAENSGINLVHFTISRAGSLTQELHNQLVQAIQYCIDNSNFPIYVHCLDGRRITSIFVLLLRKVQAWSPVYSFTEFWRYQVTFKSLQPMSEIEKATKDLEKFCSDMIEISLSDNSTPNWLYGGERSFNIPGVRLKAPAVPSTSTTLIAVVVSPTSGSTANNT